MGGTTTIPVFSPDGQLGDIPAERIHDAVAHGFKLGVTMKSPDGQIGVIPQDRVQDAMKAKMTPVMMHGGKDTSVGDIVAGAGKALGSDLVDMAKGLPRTIINNAVPETQLLPDSVRQKVGLGPAPDPIAQGQDMAAHYQEQKKAGYSLPYRAVSPVAEGVGVNVRGMEQSAQQGDVGGVLGHAAAVPTAMAATAGVAKAAPVISDVAQAAAERASRAADLVRDVTPKQAAQTAGAATGAGLGHGALSIPGAYYGAKSFGHIAEAVLGKDRANAPIFARAPELSLDNITDALAQTIADDRARFTEMQAKGLGEIPATGAKPAAQSGEALATTPTSTDLTEPPKGGKSAPRFTNADRAAAQSLLQDALKHGTQDVIDAALPTNTARGANLHTKAQVEFYLNRGDVAGAENALDSAAKQANPSWQPPQRQIVPSTNDIRARAQGQAQATAKADQLHTRALQQEMAQDLEKHGWSAESEARREFIARNSNEFSKSGKSRGYVEGEPVKLTATKSATGSGTVRRGAAPASDDLTDLLQKSLDEARQRQKEK